MAGLMDSTVRYRRGPYNPHEHQQPYSVKHLLGILCIRRRSQGGNFASGLNWSGPWYRVRIACVGKDQKCGRTTMVKRGVSQEQMCLHGRGDGPCWHKDHSKCLYSGLCRQNLAGESTRRLLSRSKVMVDTGMYHLCLPPIEKTARTQTHPGYQNLLCSVYLLCAGLPQLGSYSHALVSQAAFEIPYPCLALTG